MQLVESVRLGKKVAQRIVRHVGIAMDMDEEKQLKKLARHIKAKLEDEKNPKLFPPEVVEKLSIDQPRKQKREQLLINLKEIKEEQRLIYGIHEVYGKLYEDLGFNRVFANPARQQMATRVLRQIVLARVANPQSKRGSVTLLERDFGVRLNLDYVYRVMDKLDDPTIEEIKQLAYHHTLSLYGGKVDVIFFDITTLYFESFTEDQLKQNGYSKDGKFNQTQVLLGLITTKEGLPIGYEVFPGSTYEGHTLIPVLEKLKARYDLDKIIFVADSGLFNENNLDELEKHGYEYVVGARIKNMSKKLTEEVLDRNNYRLSPQTINPNQPGRGEDENEDARQLLIANLWYQQTKGRKLIVSYNQKRARKDAHDRQKAIDKLMVKNKTDLKKLISNYGYKKYIRVIGQTKVTIDQEKIKGAARWDGLHGVITNAKDFSETEILDHYHSLWQIEESFRINKHDLKVRPIFHWKPHRVRAHIAIAFMSYVLVRQMEYRVKLQYQKLSPEVIRNELLHVQASILLDQKTGKKYLLPSNISAHARKLYQLMGLKRTGTPYQL